LYPGRTQQPWTELMRYSGLPVYWLLPRARLGLFAFAHRFGVDKTDLSRCHPS